jgi:4-hydroxy-tetrahydrodipicolinate synthase
MQKGDDREVDYEMLRKLVDFQVDAGVSGILAMGTTGESPTLTWEEHCNVIEKVQQYSEGRCSIIAGTGSNCTREAINSTRHAVDGNVDAVLLVEPYYNGPSSLEIRMEYMAPIAESFPSVEIIPYVIPGRSGTQLLPEDLAIMVQQYDNVNAVKEASGSLENMRRSRLCAGDSLQILSGDDDMTFRMMTDESIRAQGTISVMSNIAPAAVQRMTEAALTGDRGEAERLYHALEPLFGIVTVKTQEGSPWGNRLCKARNPLPVKTLMRVLGIPVGPPRPPLGKMTLKGLQTIVNAAKKVWNSNPEILAPIADTFNVDIEQRLFNAEKMDELIYT